MTAKTPCQPFEAKLTSYLLGDLPPAQAAAVKAHAELCPACQETLRDLAATIELLRNAFAAEAVATPPCLTPERRAAVLRQAQSRPRFAGVWALLAHPYAKIALRTAAVAALLLAIVWVLLPSLARHRTIPAKVAVGPGGPAAQARQADGVTEPASVSGAVIPAQAMGAAAAAAATPEHSLNGSSAEQTVAAPLPSPLILEEKAASLAARPAAAEPVALAAQAADAAQTPSVDVDIVSKAALGTPQDRASGGGAGGGTAAVASGKAAAMAETNGTAVFAAAQPVAQPVAVAAAAPHAEAQHLVPAPAAEARPGDVRGQHRVAPGAPAKATSTVIKIPMTSGKITHNPKKAAAGSGPAASTAAAGSAVAMKSADGTATLAWATAPQSGVAREAKAAPANATADVDTAAYALARRYILLGQRPPPGSVRVKGFLNAFEYGYAPSAKPPFAIYADVVPSPFRPALDVLTVAVKGHRPGGSAAALRAVAKDVKIQVQFNPERVAGYRQFGSDNRPPVSAQSHDDTVDANEVGSGQAVTVLYEVAPGARLGEPVGVVRVRYRDVETGKIVELEKSIGVADRTADAAKAAPRIRLALGVAEFAELLRGSPSVAGSDFGQVLTVLQPVAQELPLDTGVQELVHLVQTTRDLPAAPK